MTRQRRGSTEQQKETLDNHISDNKVKIFSGKMKR
jgi:hypothetical protein